MSEGVSEGEERERKEQERVKETKDRNQCRGGVNKSESIFNTKSYHHRSSPGHCDADLSLALFHIHSRSHSRHQLACASSPCNYRSQKARQWQRDVGIL